jgi:hypothetical protein
VLKRFDGTYIRLWRASPYKRSIAEFRDIDPFARNELSLRL